MGNSGLKQHVDTAKKTGVLKLSQHKLTELPPGLLQLEHNLRTLDLSENKLNILPEEISRFMQLRQLNLRSNRLGKLPDCIGALTRLDNLNLSQNKLTVLPRTVSNLIHLKTVVLSENRLRDFPVVFGGLKHLDVLDLSKNEIVAIPSEVSHLNVVDLNLNQNQISELSSAITQCSRLKTLRLEENCLPLTAISASCVLSDSNVCHLQVEGNLFAPKQLQELPGYDAYLDRYTAVKKKLF